MNATNSPKAQNCPRLYVSPLEGLNDLSDEYERLEALQAELDSARWLSATSAGTPKAKRSSV